MSSSTLKPKLSLFLSTLLIISVFSGCTFEVEEESHHTSMGEVSELAVFSDTRTLGELSEEIEAALAPPLKGIHQAEPSFKLRIAKEEILKGFHKQNYVLFVLVNGNGWADIEDQFEAKYRNQIQRFLDMKRDTSFMISDAWASPQKVVFIVSPNRESLGEFLITKKDGFFETAIQAERKTTIRRLLRKRKDADDFYASMMDERNYGYRKPDGYRVVVRADSFIGFKKVISDRKEIGVYSYFEEYKGRHQFSKDYIIKKRNQVMKRHIHGPDRKDSLPTYITTDIEENVRIATKETSVNGQYAVETRGWYTMVNGFHGGPFVSYSIYSEKLNRVITIEGAIFAPNANVAKYLREAELIAHTYEE